MSYFRGNRKNYVQKNFEGEETEEIEEIEVNRYDSNDLYPTSLNFIIPGKSKFSTKSHNPKHKYIRKQNKLPVRSIPICTCKLPNSNYQNNYFDKIENRLPTYTNTCPYCIYENELMNENLSFKTEIDDLNYNIERTQNNDYNNQNQYRSMRNIRDNYQNEKYIMNPLPRLNRREIPYENELIYIMPYSKNNPSYEYNTMNQNIPRQNNNLEDDNIFLRDKRIVKIIRDNKIINLNEMDGDTNKNIQNNNNFYVVEQKTNNFIIDNEIIPNKNINLKKTSKDIDKKNKDVNQIYNLNNDQKINQNVVGINEQNLVKRLDIEDIKEDKEKNYNLTEENENINNNKNINIDVLENNIIQNYNSEDKMKNTEEKQNELLNDYNHENKENSNLIENSKHENLEKNIIPYDENKDLNNNENDQEIKDVNNVNINENENNNLNDEQQIEENEINDMNFEGNSNNLNDNYKKEENVILNEEEKEVEENQEPKEEDNINIKINNLDQPNNEFVKNNENNNILNQNEDIKEENEEQNEIEKEKFQIKQKEYYLNNNDNIEEVDENIEDENNIINNENENIQENKENEENQQNNSKKKENININIKLNEENNDIKNNNQKENETNKSINQKLECELNENININKIIKEKNETENQLSSSSKKKVIPANKNFKYKVPQTGELLFNPKTGKKKNVEPLFSKYELLEGQETYQNLNSLTQPKETLFKKTIEIFPSRFGVEMPYKSQIRQDDYMLNNNNLERKNLSKTTSDKKTKKLNINKKLANKDQLNIAKFEKKNYYKYKSNIKSNNPFIGLSHYDKNTKERKNIISKTVQKEENEFYDIIILEENILKKRDLTEEELNQFINILIKYMFESEEKNLDNKDAYEFKINKISNIIINMKKEEQNKVLETLKNNAKDEYSNELFTQLKTKINDFKDKIAKSYKKEENLEDEEFENISNSSNKKKYKK